MKSQTSISLGFLFAMLATTVCCKEQQAAGNLRRKLHNHGNSPHAAPEPRFPPTFAEETEHQTTHMNRMMGNHYGGDHGGDHGGGGYYYPPPPPPDPYPPPPPPCDPYYDPYCVFPTERPTPRPTPLPTDRPTPRPTRRPTPRPTYHPTPYPSEEPSETPTNSEEPSESPTSSEEPSESPTSSEEPSESPTSSLGLTLAEIICAEVNDALFGTLCDILGLTPAVFGILNDNIFIDFADQGPAETFDAERFVVQFRNTPLPKTNNPEASVNLTPNDVSGDNNENDINRLRRVKDGKKVNDGLRRLQGCSANRPDPDAHWREWQEYGEQCDGGQGCSNQQECEAYARQLNVVIIQEEELISYRPNDQIKFTMFAPTNGAISRLLRRPINEIFDQEDEEIVEYFEDRDIDITDDDALVLEFILRRDTRDILNYILLTHIFDRELESPLRCDRSYQMLSLQETTTLCPRFATQGRRARYQVGEGNIALDYEPRVYAVDAFASNGVLQVVDEVILPDLTEIPELVNLPDLIDIIIGTPTRSPARRPSHKSCVPFDTRSSVDCNVVYGEVPDDDIPQYNHIYTYNCEYSESVPGLQQPFSACCNFEDDTIDVSSQEMSYWGVDNAPGECELVEGRISPELPASGLMPEENQCIPGWVNEYTNCTHQYGPYSGLTQQYSCNYPLVDVQGPHFACCNFDTPVGFELQDFSYWGDNPTSGICTSLSTPTTAPAATPTSRPGSPTPSPVAPTRAPTNPPTNPLVIANFVICSLPSQCDDLNDEINDQSFLDIVGVPPGVVQFGGGSSCSAGLTCSDGRQFTALNIVSRNFGAEELLTLAQGQFSGDVTVDYQRTNQQPSNRSDNKRGNNKRKRQRNKRQNNP